MFNITPTFLIKFKPIILLCLLLPLFITSCGGNSGGSSSTALTNTNAGTTPVQAGSTAVPTTLQGQWLRVDTGEKIWLGQQSNLNYTQTNSDILEVIDGASKYYLIRAGVSNVAVSGGIILSGVVVSPIKSKASQVKAIASIPTIELVNVSDPYVNATVQVDNYGQFSANLPSGTYRVRSTATTGESVDAQVTIERDAIDIGTFNLKKASAPNFKSEILDNEYFYFGSLLGQGSVNYTKTIRVKNLTSNNATGMQVSISSSDPYVDTYSFIPQAAGVQAGAFMDVDLNFTFKRPPADRTVHFNIAITYYDLALTQYTWRDTVDMELSAHPPVKLYFDVPKIVQTGNKGANGYLITPGRTLKKISATTTVGDTILVPYIAGQSYNIVFANPAAISETPYGIGVAVPTSNFAIQTFNNIPLNEPADNTAALATPLVLNDRHISYLHQGDIDHYKLTFDALNAPFDPHLLKTTNITASVGNTGTFTGVHDTTVTTNKNMFVIEYNNLGTLFLRYYDATGTAINAGVLGQSIFGGIITPPSTIKSSGNYLYFTNAGQVKIYDGANTNFISIQASFGITTSQVFSAPSILDTIIADPYVYTLIHDTVGTGITYLQINDWNNKLLNPAFVSITNIGNFSGSMPTMGVNGDRVAVYGTMNGSMVIVDVSSRASPMLSTQLIGLPNLVGMPVKISNQKIYLRQGNQFSQLRVIDATDITNLIDLGSFNLPSALPRGYSSTDFTVTGSTAYFTTGSYYDSNGTKIIKSNGFQIVDISDLNNIVSLGSAFDPIPDPNSFPASNMQIIGNELFLSKKFGVAGYPPTIMKFQLQ